MILHDSILVKFRTWDEVRIRAVVEECGGVVGHLMPQIGWVIVSLDPKRASDVFRAVGDHPEIVDVNVDEVIEPHAVTAYHGICTNPMAETLHALKRLNLFAAWKVTKGSPDILVSVCDYACASNLHEYPEYLGKPPVPRYDAQLDTEPDTAIVPMGSGLSHADHCIGVIWANHGGAGPPGFAPDCSMMSMAISFAYSGIGRTLAGWLKSIDLGANIITMSWGNGPPNGINPTTWMASIGSSTRDAFLYATASNCLIFVSMGNSGLDDRAGDPPRFPRLFQHPAAECAQMGHFGVGVSTYEQVDRPSPYTNYGEYPNVVTPGHRYPVPNYEYHLMAGAPTDWISPFGNAESRYSLNGAVIRHNYHYFAGTSCASPMAAGVCALIWSVNPNMSATTVHDIYVSSLDKGQHPEFLARFTRPGLHGVGVPNAGKGVRQALTTLPENAGVVIPYLNFFGDGVDITVSAGVATTHLYGTVYAEATGFCSVGTVNRVQLIAEPGGDVLYDDEPRTTWDSLIPLAAARLVGKQIRIVAYTDTASGEDTYSDIVGHAVSNNPPTTRAEPPDGTQTGLISLVVESENLPATTYYRWDGGEWQTYSAPFPVQSGSLEFYSVDCLGNDERGT